MQSTANSNKIATQLLKAIWHAAQGNEHLLNRVTFNGAGELPSVFAVTDLAAASMGAAGLALSSLLDAMDSTVTRDSTDLVSAFAGVGAAFKPSATPTSRTTSIKTVTVDRRLASFWFAYSLRPIGWQPSSAEDFVMGDYETSDGCYPM